jgi:hypothetical protein
MTTTIGGRMQANGRDPGKILDKMQKILIETVEI